MPTYDYVCKACGHCWELFQSIKDSPKRSCPECKARKAQRLIGAGAGIIFKGSGFYETDYKRKSGTPEPSKPAESTGSDSKSTPKSEPSSSAAT